MTKSSSPYRALRNQDYRLYFFGQLISMSGSWMQAVIQGWLVYQFTHSAQWLGWIAVANQIPSLLLSPIGGVVADRMDRRKLLLGVETIQMAQSLAFAALIFSGKIAAWHVALLAACLGTASAFELATRHAFTGDVAGPDDLPSALTLNVVIINLSRILGPALAGFLIDIVGEGACVLLNALSFLAVIYGLSRMRITPSWSASAAGRRSVMKEFGHAVNVARESTRIKRVLAMTLFTGIFTFPFAVVFPVLAKTVLNGDASTLSWLTATGGLGAVIGVLSIRWRPDDGRQETQMLLEMGLGCAALISLGLSSRTYAVFASAFFIGFFAMRIFPKANHAIQKCVAPDLRGRMLSLYTTTFLAAAPLGSLLLSSLTERYGTRTALVSTGSTGIVLLLATVVWFGILTTPAARR